jgi:hypothetical protein
MRTLKASKDQNSPADASRWRLRLFNGGPQARLDDEHSGGPFEWREGRGDGARVSRGGTFESKEN